MKQYYYLEGHRAKTDYSPEDTLVLEDKRAYATEETALKKAREHFEKDKELGLMVIYKGVKGGDRYGKRFIFRNQNGLLEEVDNWWSDTAY
jgi:hypothetical protein